MSEREGAEALIRSLAGELRPVRRLRSPWVRALVWIGAVAVTAVALAWVGGVGTVSRKLAGGPGEYAELVGAGLTALLAGFAAFLLSVPDRSPVWALLPLPPFALWVGASSWGCWRTGVAGTEVVGAHAPRSCFIFIVGVSVPLSALLVLLLRRAYSVRPSLTALLGGLAAAGASAMLLEFFHPFDITLPDLAAHLGAVLLVIAANLVLSSRALRRVAVAMAVLAVPAASRAGETRPVVLELFTSQGCSSCPPADALLTEYARNRPDLLPLAFHVEYWNNLGWRDPFSFAGATSRQRQHASQLGDATIYTPELVVDGAQAEIGSDRGAIENAIAAARARQRTLASVQVSRSASGEVAITVGGGTGQAAVVLLGFDSSHVTPVGRGENTGRTLLESNIVRSIETVGHWAGAPLELRRPAPAGEQVAVLLEAPDGKVVGAAHTKAR